jgi:transcriptional regulator GlxA family with amidase domain
MHDFTVLALSGSYASSVALTHDLLAAAQALASRVGAPQPRWRLCSLAGGTLPLAGGMRIATTRLPRHARNDRSLWIIPGLGLNTPAAVAARLAEADVAAAVPLIARHVRGGGRIAASCSAVFLLQAAGLLAGRRVTTTWWLAPYLQQMAPTCSVDADQMVCVDGPVVTAGAAFAQSDLMLHLLRERCGPQLAAQVSRMTLLDARQAQAPFIVPEVMASGSALVASITAKVESCLPNPPSVADLAREFCMSERTLSRHVRRATGKSTVALLQGIRLRRARTLLENSRMSVERVAEAVGYQGSTALRRLVRKVNGFNPSRFRSSV